MNARLNVGLIGLGRLGRVYAMNLAQRVPAARLVAVADQQPKLAESTAREFEVPRWYASHRDLLEDKSVDAVVVITSTSTHKEVVIDAVAAGKPVFCEKPMALSMADSLEMAKAIESRNAFFQIGFQRRFDAGYVAAKKKLDAGVIGEPVLITEISRDPFRPALEYCNPAVSGGLIIDMGIHDFDVARMFLGDVRSVYATGATLAYPEMKQVGDIDNAVVNLTFANGKLGVVQLSRNAVFGYDIRAEIWGTAGSLQIGYFRQTPILVMTKEGITHDVVPYFMERFEAAYLAQIGDFVENVRLGRPPALTAADALAALRISEAATLSLALNAPVQVAEVEAAHAG